MTSCDSAQGKKNLKMRSNLHILCGWLIVLQRLQFNLVFVSFQGSYETAEEIPKAVWCPSEVGPEIPGLDLFISISGLEEKGN